MSLYDSHLIHWPHPIKIHVSTYSQAYSLILDDVISGVVCVMAGELVDDAVTQADKGLLKTKSYDRCSPKLHVSTQIFTMY